MIENIIIIAVIAVIITAVVIYLVRAKKRGEHCIGCPYAKQCSGKCSDKNHNNNSKKQ